MRAVPGLPRGNRSKRVDRRRGGFDSVVKNLAGNIHPRAEKVILRFQVSRSEVVAKLVDNGTRQRDSGVSVGLSLREPKGLPLGKRIAVATIKVHYNARAVPVP
jgi:hypothetical protein